MINSKFMGNQEIPISVLLDNIENAYNNNYFIYKINDSISLKVGWPSEIYIDETIKINYSSGIYSVIKNGTEYVLTKDERNKLIETLQPSVLIDIEIDAIKKLSVICELYKGLDGAKFDIDLITSNIFYIVFQIYKDSLDNFYMSMYSAIHYLKMTYMDFNDITPNELTILFNLMVKDSEEQKKKMEEEKNGNSNRPTIGRGTPNIGI